MPALRFLAAYVLLTAVMYAWGTDYSSRWCKPFEVAIAALPSPVVMMSVGVAESSNQRVFVLQARTHDMIQTPGGTVPAGIKLQSTTLQAYAHHHLILIFATLAAWPVQRRMERAALLAAGVPAIAAATLLDLPFTLLGVARDTILAASDPDRLGNDVAVLYFQFLQRGGRQALSLAAAGLVIVLRGPSRVSAIRSTDRIAV